MALRVSIEQDLALVVVLACSHTEIGERRTGAMQRRQQTAGRGEIGRILRGKGRDWLEWVGEEPDLLDLARVGARRGCRGR